MSLIKWSKEEDPSHDACGRTNDGTWCDVVRNYRNTWSARVACQLIGEFPTKELGKEACEEYVIFF